MNNQFHSEHQSAGPINQFETLSSQQEEFNVVKLPRTRRDSTNDIVDRLYDATFISRVGERVAKRSGRRNKNEVLGLTLARLIKEKYLNGIKYSRDIEILKGIQTNLNNGEFMIVLRTDGRIVALSDEIEQHFGKSMRLLYSQCINIFECLNKTDGDKLRSVLNCSSDLTPREYRLVCTFHLPKGKRPSRAREDIKTITMAGHFYSCDDSSPQEKLFVARCETLLSQTVTTGSNSSQSSMVTNSNSNSMIKLTLNEDMSIQTFSPNVEKILGYSRNELIGTWFGRFLPTNDLEKFEIIRQRNFQNEQKQQLPTNVCDVFDIYTNNGDGRLTFLFQIRPIRERRSKLIKFVLLGQLVDPSLRDEYGKYIQSETIKIVKPIQPEQVNLGAKCLFSSPIQKPSEESIVANSPTLAMGLLMFDNGYINEFSQYQQFSPVYRKLSNGVAPFDFIEQSSDEFFNFDLKEFSTITDPFDEIFNQCQSHEEFTDFFDQYLDFNS